MARILVVDDEPGIRHVLKQLFEYEDHEVRDAGGGSEAVDLYRDFRPDVTFLDVKMARMDGLEVLSKIREVDPAAVVVMISGHGTIDTAVEATRRGAFDFLEKPLDTERLLIVLRNSLQQQGLKAENARLRGEVESRHQIVGRSFALRQVLDRVEKVAPTDARVLITGENGTGKELVARAVHEHSRRADGPFIKLNCAAIPSELIESELFGHEKGSFTGATKDRRGKFEQADGGTLFLDEIGDMNPSAQAKVLRALQEGELERVGGTETIKVDVRVIAATNKDLAAEIAAGRFREDLFYRLNVVPIEMPPLRARKDDIPALIEHFLAMACARDDRRVKRMTPSAVTLMMQHDWPGNVRELKNVVERMVILTGDSDLIGEPDVRDALPRVQPVKGHYEAGTPFKDLVAAAEREIILAALEAHDHHVSNTAKDLQLERSHLYKKMRALGIDHRADDEAAG
ncbi:MAG: sigma-54-dependent transcriptional regulator [Longimicrobiaceae bacterium]